MTVPTPHHEIDLRALVLVCSLKRSPEPSSSELLGRQVLQQLQPYGVTGEVLRVVDHSVRFGVTTDEGDGDGWPGIRAKLLASDILVLATPIWLGQPSSVCKVVLERLDAELGETDDERSEEHTSELQSRQYLVCRLLLEKKKISTIKYV